MATLTPRTIEWIDSAPIHFEATAESTAAPAEVFAVLADHEKWPEWFPMVRKVTVLGPASGVGARRRVSIPGVWFDEEFIVWEPGERWSFTGTSCRPGITKSLVEDCVLRGLPNGGTAITYTMYMDPPKALLPVLKVMAGRLKANNRRAMERLAARAASLASS